MATLRALIGFLAIRRAGATSKERCIQFEPQCVTPILMFFSISLLSTYSLAVPMIVDRDHFTNRFAPNSIPGTPVGDNVQIAAVLNSVDPVGSPTISVKAVQGDTIVMLDYIGAQHTLFNGIHLYYTFIDFDPTLTGSWEITASDSTGTSTSVLTNVIPNPEFVPYATNIRVQGSSSSARVSWDLPDLSEYDVNIAAVRIFDASSGGILFQSPVLALQTTSYQPPAGVLQSGVRYAFNVILSDDESFGHENASWGFSEPFRLTVEGDYNQNGTVDAADYTVWRDNLGAGALLNRGVGVNGPIGTADYDVWKAHFGQSLGAGNGAAGYPLCDFAASLSPAIPEPSTLVLAIMTMAASLLVKRSPAPARWPKSALEFGRQTC